MSTAVCSPIYEIVVQGHFGPRWCERFAPLAAHAVDGGTTVLRGRIADQAALHGVLRNLERTGVVLLSLACLDEPSGVGRARV